MKLLISLLVVAVLSLGARAQRVDAPETQTAAKALAQQAKETLGSDPEDEEPGDVTDEEASRPATPVSEGVWRSSRPNAVAIDRLYDLGVRTILNLEDKKHLDEERRLLDEAQARRETAGKPSWRIVQVHVRMSGIHPPTFAQLDDALDALADAARRPILVHCKHGEDRTGVVVSAFRVEVEKSMDRDQAVAEAKSFHCCHLVVPGEHGLLRYLQLYRWRR